MSRKVNRYILHDDYAEIELYHPNTYVVKNIAYISLEDVPIAKEIYWRESEYGYVRGWNKDTQRDVLLHVYIIGTNTKVDLLDHINRNKLDCRRTNLRLANKQINSLNREPPKNSTTQVKGVSYDKRRKKYRSYIKINQKQVFLGYFTNIDDADIARKKYENNIEVEQ